MDNWVEQLSRGIAFGSGDSATNNVDSAAVDPQHAVRSQRSAFDVFGPFGGLTPPPKRSAATLPSPLTKSMMLHGGQDKPSALMFSDVTNTPPIGRTLKDLSVSSEPAPGFFATSSTAGRPNTIATGAGSSGVIQQPTPGSTTFDPTSPSAASATVSSPPELLVRGDVLSAAKLLQLTKASQSQSQSVSQQGSVWRHLSGDSTPHSPDSRSSTPHSVANAVLEDDDDDDVSAGIGHLARQMAARTGGSRTDYHQTFFSSSSRSETPDDMKPLSSPTTGLEPSLQHLRFDSWSSAMRGESNTVRSSTVSSTASSNPPSSFTVVSGSMPAQSQHKGARTNPSNAADASWPSARRIVGNMSQPSAAAAAGGSCSQFAPMNPRDLTIILEFKMKRLVRFRCPLDVGTVSLQQFCIVQFDHTEVEDAGMCVAMYTHAERYTIPRSFGPSDSGVVLRLATTQDCLVINDQLPVLEEVGLSAACQLIHFLHLPFVCVDAEYTFDRKQVKMFYSLAPQSSTSIVPNFSRFQRELAFKLGCKVTIEQMK